MKPLRWIMCACAVPFAAAALFHAAACVRPSLTPGEPTWRHAVFVAVNVVLAAGLARASRPLVFVVAFAIFAVQQTWSHGTDLVEASRAGATDVRSVAVLGFVPFVLLLLLLERVVPPRCK